MSEKSRAYYAAHREERRASARASYARHREERLAKRKAYYRANRNRCLEWWRMHRTKPEVRAYRRVYYKRRYANTLMLWAVDAAAYAQARRKGRIYRAKKAVLEGRVYKPQFARRIPDWCVMGHVLDARSPWLVENLTPSQRAYARELAIERGAL